MSESAQSLESEATKKSINDCIEDWLIQAKKRRIRQE